MNDYSYLDRLLHHIALGSNTLAELTFDLEKAFFKIKSTSKDAVYVTGLARAGTTALMRELYSSGKFASLTYNDMPFVLSPNIWNYITKFDKKYINLKERAHNDGIMVDIDSPEALEEVFWRVIAKCNLIQNKTLKIHEIDLDAVMNLRYYQALICNKYVKSRYLAKNNNHILRLTSLASQAPDMKFLVLFRNPIDQSMSLMNQHLRFLNADPFTKKYMGWLAHHDFGTTYLPLSFLKPGSLRPRIINQDYWLEVWCTCYEYILSILNKGLSNVIPVSYERLCEKTEYWELLCHKIEIPYQQPNFSLSKNPINTSVSQEALTQAMELYKALDQKTVEVLY